MATARKLPSGSWRCQVYSHTEKIVQPDGTTKEKRIYKSFTCDIPGPQGKRACEKMAADWAENKEQAPKQSMTFGQAMNNYIESREHVLSPRSIADYKNIRKHHLQGIMDVEITAITQEMIQKEINIAAMSLSPKTVRNIHGAVSAVLRIYRPGFALNTALPKKKRIELYIPTDEEVKRLLEAVRGSEMELPILLAAFGPMRRGEIAALEASDITGNIVHVSKNMILGGDRQWIIKAPKSYAGDRYIDYPDFVAEKWKGRVGYIVGLNPHQITDRFQTCLKLAGLPRFRFHDLRHYSASIQHALGIPDSYIMQRGGWGNDGTLKAVYRHALKDKSQEMNKIANSHFEMLMQHEMQHGNKKTP